MLSRIGNNDNLTDASRPLREGETDCVVEEGTLAPSLSGSVNKTFSENWGS